MVLRVASCLKSAPTCAPGLFMPFLIAVQTSCDLFPQLVATVQLRSGWDGITTWRHDMGTGRLQRPFRGECSPYGSGLLLGHRKVTAGLGRACGSPSGSRSEVRTGLAWRRVCVCRKSGPRHGTLTARAGSTSCICSERSGEPAVWLSEGTDKK